MTWARVIAPGPPTADQLNHWERDGWEIRHIVGPAPTVDPKTGAPAGSAYAIYLRRSPLAPAPTRRPGFPLNPSPIQGPGGGPAR